MVMETNAEMANASSSTTDLQKAWHISSILLCLRRPARPTELAIRCTLFRATPELIEFLCCIPNSPIHLTPSYFVTLSSSGYLTIVQFFANSNVNLDFLPRLRFDSLFTANFGKRKRTRVEDEFLRQPKRREGENQVVIRNQYPEVYFLEPSVVAFDAHQLQEAVFRPSFFIKSSEELSKICVESNAKSDEMGAPISIRRSEVSYSSTTGLQIFPHPFCPTIPEHQKINAYPIRELDSHSTQQFSVLSMKALISEEAWAEGRNLSASSDLQLEDHNGHPKKEVETAVHPCETIVEDVKVIESGQAGANRESFVNLLIDMTRKGRYVMDKQSENVAAGCTRIPSAEVEVGKQLLEKEATTEIPKELLNNQDTTEILNGHNQAILNSELASVQNPPAEASVYSKFDEKELNQNVQCRTSENPQAACYPTTQVQTKRDKISFPSKQHLKCNLDKKMGVKEKQETADKIGNSSLLSSHDQLEHKVLPHFESFIVEEEEGSGGYGTVYRARRKTDGVTFAIKSPHVNANRNHVHNEVKMLERFGGKNFVIRYEGSIKSANSECLVLEHVEHDRPEALKKEIDVCELQWYGYCMFRALAALHKQGIVHRDVKPGNFLFNRKTCKGYLIDFNLAMDLNHKYSNPGKTKEDRDMNYRNVPRSCSKPLPPIKSKKPLTPESARKANHDQGKVFKPLAISKDMKKKIEKYNRNAEVGRSIIKSQGADGSGITSAKDATSTKTPSAEKFREPLPCQGRKELINLVQEALQGANREGGSVTVSKRKRVAAPPEKVDHKFVYLTPMPLQSAGGVVGGAGLLKNKDGKVKREGPCVGTKGFRAPEVLFRSQHQGPKIDMWSAGVTLLYLMLGRAPFVGDPDQNAKDIAKLRGSEDLWEVAKLHNCESLFPGELFDIKFLRSMTLKEWCKLNTRRPDFLKVIPNSLFDLVDKCLAVNPRLRISADEALRHDFFTPCHEALRKHRMVRQGVISLDSGSLHLKQGHSQTCREVS